MAARLVVSMQDPTPPYEQLRRQLAGLIGDGVLHAGDRLPALRQLAGDLGLAVGTVARTYRELESAGLVQSRHGGGTRVAVTPQPPAGAPGNVDSAVRRELGSAVARVLAMGAAPDQVRSLVEEALESVATSTINDPA
jgi:GntR family transcriptional regulator